MIIELANSCGFQWGLQTEQMYALFESTTYSITEWLWCIWIKITPQTNNYPARTTEPDAIARKEMLEGFA